MKIKLVAFDWNGTIMADVSTMVRANNAVFKHFGFKEITLSHYRKHFRVPIKDYWVSLGFDPNFFDQHAEEQEIVFRKNFEHGENRARTRAGAKELLRFLEDKKIERIIFSNHIVPDIEKRLEQLKINKYFGAILGRPLGGRGHQHKRFKDGYLNDYVKSKRLKPAEVMVIGDTDEEIEIGKKFGYTTVALSGGHQSLARLKIHKPTYLIHNLREAIKIVQNHEQ